MRCCTFLLLLTLFPTGNGLFWDILNCPLCYLPRIEFGSPYYYQPPPPVAETPVITQAVQPVQQVQYVYKQPIVKYLQPVKYVYLQNGGAGGGGYPAGNGNSGYNSAQPPHQPYKMSQQYLASRGYSTGSGYNSGPSASSSSYPTGRYSSGSFEPVDNIQTAPYAHKLPSSKSSHNSQQGKKGKNKSEKKKITTTTSKSTEDEDDLVAWEDEDAGTTVSPVEDIKKRKKTFHIHEDVGGKPFPSPKGKSSSLPIAEEEEDLDILTTDDHMKPSEKTLEGGGKPPEDTETEMIGIDGPESTTEPGTTVQAEEKNSKEMIAVVPAGQGGEFFAIGKDTESSKISKINPASPPPNLKGGHKEEENPDSFEAEMEELEDGDSQ